MKEFTHEEIIDSLKDDTVHLPIMSCLFLDDIQELKSELNDQKRDLLAQRIKSKLVPDAIKDLQQKNIFEENGELSNLGLAHIHLFLKENALVKEKEDASENENKISKKWWKFWN